MHTVSKTTWHYKLIPPPPSPSTHATVQPFLRDQRRVVKQLPRRRKRVSLLRRRLMCSNNRFFKKLFIYNGNSVTMN